MKLNIYKQTKARLPRQKLNTIFTKLTNKELPLKKYGQINLIFTTDRKLKELNNQFRGINRSTDVLSFNIDPPDHADNIYGEIYIAVPYAAKQAIQYGNMLNDELLRLFCHGLLHLFGYDHKENPSAKVMQERELFYLKNFKVSNL
jgi:probable rRNA maturation factor